MRSWRTRADARRAQRLADGNLLLAAGGARQEEVREVGASDQQGAADRGEQDAERAADIAHGHFMERREHRALAGVGAWILCGELARDAAHFGGGLRAR